MAALILASASPRRLELLQQIGLFATVRVANIDETALADEAPEQCVQRLAMTKAQKVAKENPEAWVIAADTFGVLDNQLLLKPTSETDAIAMWSAMSGCWHDILTAVAIIKGDESLVRLNRSRVLFAPLSQQQMLDYWQTGEPQDKAGAYAIQGLAAIWIKEIRGSYSAIMGLPLYETAQMLAQLNYPLLTSTQNRDV